jgi:hypothetical protein
MGTTLRVLTIILVFLSAGALTLGTMLFGKRELLKGRTQMLENRLVALTEAYIEDKQADKGEGAPTPLPIGRDTDECTAAANDNPKLSPFWDSYKFELEKVDLEKTKVRPGRLKELMTYYKVNPAELHWLTGQPVVEKDEFGVPKIEGPGTMNDLLQELTTKAANQYHTLNSTRIQLKELREELMKTIDELNKQKKELRLRLAEIVQLKKKIAELEEKIRQLEKKIQDLEEEKRVLQDKVAEQDKKIKELEEQKVELQTQIEELKKEIKKLKEIDPTKIQMEGIVYRFEPGAKGKVATVNPQWNFVVLDLDDAFLAELAQYKGPTAPEPELLIKRVMPGKEDEFVTKAKLTQIKKVRKLGIADILTDWQQKQVQVGDVVCF